MPRIERAERGNLVTRLILDKAELVTHVELAVTQHHDLAVDGGERWGRKPDRANQQQPHTRQQHSEVKFAHQRTCLLVMTKIKSIPAALQVRGRRCFIRLIRLLAVQASQPSTIDRPREMDV